MRFQAPAPETVGPGGERYIALTTRAETGGLYFLTHVVVPAGGGPSTHTHEREETSLYILRGELVVQVGASAGPMRAGTFLVLPRSIPHAFRNAGPDEAEALLWFSPGAIEELFRGTAHQSASDFRERARVFGIEFQDDDSLHSGAQGAHGPWRPISASDDRDGGSSNRPDEQPRKERDDS
jgi:quercetin dioxygenase-like cupin family protein